MKISKISKLTLAICILLYLILPSCGYRVYRTSELPVTSVKIGSVENHTTEPGLQDIFIRVLTEEMLRNGLTPSVTSGYVVSAILTDYKLNTLSIKNSFSAEYSVLIKADITFSYPDGTVRELKGVSSEFMETFAAADDIQSIQSQKESATEKAIKDLGQRIIAEMTYSTIHK